MMTTSLAVAFVGLIAGVRHAFEADHMAAVGTLATQRGSAGDAARLGASWALGHTAAVGAVAGGILALGVSPPDGFYGLAELLVAALLIGLGGAVMLRSRSTGSRATHRVPRAAEASFAFGVAHGVAGSGAVAAFLVVAAPSHALRLACFAGFALGTMAGMLLVSAGVALVVHRTHTAGVRWVPALQLCTGAASILAGLLLAAGSLAV